MYRAAFTASDKVGFWGRAIRWLSRLPGHTWHWETAFVTLILATVAIATGSKPVEWLGSLAVLVGFGHASIGVRMAEREAQRVKPSVECYAKQVVYYVAKELLWASYFISTHAWSALVGCGVFLAYPFWRATWRRYNPIADVV